MLALTRVREAPHAVQARPVMHAPEVLQVVSSCSVAKKCKRCGSPWCDVDEYEGSGGVMSCV